MHEIDDSAFPDVGDTQDLPSTLATDEDMADYVARICAAWDFDIFPERSTFDLLAGWRRVFDRFPLPQSPAYHTFRSVFGWPAVSRVRNPNVHLTYRVLDRLEGRDPDPFEDCV